MATITKVVSKGGNVSYQVKIRLSGYPHKSAIFERLGEARNWATRNESDMKVGRHMKELLARKYTAAELIDRYLQEVLEAKSTKKRYLKDQRVQLLWWRRQIGEYKLINVTPYLIAEHRDKLRNDSVKKRTSGTVNRYLAVLSHVFNVAIKEWGWVENNPTMHIQKLKEPRGRVRFLSDNERDVLLNACKGEKKKPLYIIVVLAISTGARKSEILNLQMEDVDLKRQVITVQETKNGERRQLFLSGLALELLNTYLKHRTHRGFVFPSSTRKNPVNIDREWQATTKKAGITDFRFHDLRHTAASYLAMNGASIAEIAEVLGHKTLNMVKRYAHLSKTHTASVVASMNEKVFGALEVKTSSPP